MMVLQNYWTNRKYLKGQNIHIALRYCTMRFDKKEGFGKIYCAECLVADWLKEGGIPSHLYSVLGLVLFSGEVPPLTCQVLRFR